MNKAKIKEGVVENIIEVDPSNIPDWCAKWPDATDDCRIGSTWNGVSFITPVVSIDETAESVRTKRDSLLVHVVDSVAGNVLCWADLHPVKKEEIVNFRRALLDVPQQVGFPLSVDWPPVPSV